MARFVPRGTRLRALACARARACVLVGVHVLLGVHVLIGVHASAHLLHRLLGEMESAPQWASVFGVCAFMQAGIPTHTCAHPCRRSAPVHTSQSLCGGRAHQFRHLHAPVHTHWHRGVHGCFFGVHGLFFWCAHLRTFNRCSTVDYCGI